MVYPKTYEKRLGVKGHENCFQSLLSLSHYNGIILYVVHQENKTDLNLQCNFAQFLGNILGIVLYNVTLVSVLNCRHLQKAMQVVYIIAIIGVKLFWERFGIVDLPSCWTARLKCNLRWRLTLQALVGLKYSTVQNGQWNWSQHVRHWSYLGNVLPFCIVMCITLADVDIQAVQQPRREFAVWQRMRCINVTGLGCKLEAAALPFTATSDTRTRLLLKILCRHNNVSKSNHSDLRETSYVQALPCNLPIHLMDLMDLFLNKGSSQRNFSRGSHLNFLPALTCEYPST